jgi:ceramide glucosyltransferase
MVLSFILGTLALLALALTFWQWYEGWRFGLHRRAAAPGFAPPLTVLKPLKGCDGETAACLHSWLAQDYPGPVQILFGVATAADPVCEVVRSLLAEFPRADAQLVLCPAALGPNAKVSKLAQLEPLAKHELLIVSDADVRVPPDLLCNLVAPFQDPAVGLVNPFYRLANPATLPMRWEAVAVNADFWSSVLQARRLAPLDFALGAVMAVRRQRLEALGGFRALVDYLADDFELGRRVARSGARLALCPVVVDCCEPPQNWGAVWRHQLRWARTIRVCRPAPYALSILSNATLWPLLWLAAQPHGPAPYVAALCLGVRLLTAADNQRRLTQSLANMPWLWLAPVKDVLQSALWALAFLGNRVEWRGQRYRVDRSGKLIGDCFLDAGQVSP